MRPEKLRDFVLRTKIACLLKTPYIHLMILYTKDILSLASKTGKTKPFVTASVAQ
jgi:hypothetical protein